MKKVLLVIMFAVFVLTCCNKNSSCIYSIVKIERSIFTGQSGKAVKITDGNAPKWSYFFSYSFSNDSLFLSQEAYDGWGYVFKRLR